MKHKKLMVLLACLLPFLAGCWTKDLVRDEIRKTKSDAVFWKTDGDDIIYHAKSDDGNDCELHRVQWGDTAGIISDTVFATKHIQFCETMDALIKKEQELSDLQEEFDRFRYAVCPAWPDGCFYQ